MSSSPDYIPNQLRRFRMERGLSQREVARLLGLESASMICRWEQGRSLPSTMNLLRLAAIYHRTIDNLYWDVILNIRAELKKKEGKIIRTDDAPL